MENAKEFDLAAFAGGAVSERIQDAIQKVYENIADPNTELDKARKLTIELIFKPSKTDREMVDVQVVAKTTLQPRKAINSTMVIAKDNNGAVIAQEWDKNVMRGQQEIHADETRGVIDLQSRAK
ncbi:replication terminator protein [Anaerotignum sp.]|uniref:replication terminator protein n=1 Tax=Anaerotignum sp. TaxID=2039241 RepID=UPI0028B0233D|nr:replication terminator protein [Anaerotignum sp.]